MSSTSTVTTSAPRRSISNAQNPSQVPMSSTRMPSSRSGIIVRWTIPRQSTSPGVVTPPGSSSVWYQLVVPTAARRSPFVCDAAASNSGAQ